MEEGVERGEVLQESFRASVEGGAGDRSVGEAVERRCHWPDGAFEKGSPGFRPPDKEQLFQDAPVGGEGFLVKPRGRPGGTDLRGHPARPCFLADVPCHCRQHKAERLRAPSLEEGRGFWEIRFLDQEPPDVRPGPADSLGRILTQGERPASPAYDLGEAGKRHGIVVRPKEWDIGFALQEVLKGDEGKRLVRVV